MSTPKQQTVLSQPPPLLAGRSPTVHKAGWPDMFVIMLEGSAFRLDVGSNENLRTFILPRALLAQHSLYIYKCLFLSHNGFKNTKKRKLSQVSCEEVSEENTARPKGAGVAIKVESDTDENETKDEKELLVGHIRLPEVDPVLFGLFLHYIYKDVYPRNIDTVMPSVPRQQYSHPPTASNSVPKAPNQHLSANLPACTEPAKRQYVSPGTFSSTNIPATSTIARQGSEASTSPSNSKAADKLTLPISTQRPPTPSTSSPLTPNPTPPPPSTPGPSNRQLVNKTPWFSNLPTSVQAYFLGYRLGACAFINYTMTRIHSAIGTSFHLTPGLVCTIWYCTQPIPEAPLRRLMLDCLVTYWSHPEPRVRALYIHPDERGWETVFDSCRDVRNYLIRGMQNGVRVGSPEAYHITRKMMIDSNWEQVGVGQEGGASAGPGPGPDPGAGEKM